MTNVLRISAASFNVTPLFPLKCADSLIDTLFSVSKFLPDLVVFPASCLVGASAGNLNSNYAVKNELEEALALVIDRCSNCDFAVALSLPYGNGIIRDGKIEIMNNPCEFEFKGFKCLFYCGDLDSLIRNYDVSSADLIIIESSLNITAGKIAVERDSAKVVSRIYSNAIVFCNGSSGESSAPNLYKSFCGVYENGNEIAFSRDEISQVICDIDADILGRNIENKTERDHLIRDVRKNPFLPKENENKYLDELFDLQVSSLTTRLRNTKIDKLVLGVSGGLDSTLAMLVAVETLDRLQLPRENLTAITMPGMGTSGRTYSNSKKIIEMFCADGREISIKESVLKHFDDIGHYQKNHSVVYENSQARERTQILFDIANQIGGIVVGTGDLSEAALGFCTFNGDHMAGFNVNSSITKTIARLMVKRLSGYKKFEDAKNILDDILNTAVSPELLPPDEFGNIIQSTEEILGPYELHEFYLYYFVKYNMAPSKIYSYAKIAFKEYDSDFILKTLKLFIKRFISSQFKRACAPESAVITDLTLDTSKFRFPSDAGAESFLRELDMIN